MPLTRFARYAWATLIWNVIVVLWGAFVSSSGSGAGCGEHWPLCQGAIVPHPNAIQTVIEFSHRLSSGLALLLVAGLLVWAWRLKPVDQRVRRGAIVAALFIILESLVGAMLVLRGWVAFDASLARVLIQPVHLNNTLLLLASLAFIAWAASGGPVIDWRQTGWRPWAFGLSLLGVMFIGSSGALISLGDLLALGLGERYNSIVQMLVGLRLWHPGVAIVIGAGLLWLALLAPNVRPNAQAERLARLTAGLVVCQWLVGFVNVQLRVPIWTQLLHLLVADLTWFALLFWAGYALAKPAARPT